jgi:hypothetical protein
MQAFCFFDRLSLARGVTAAYHKSLLNSHAALQEISSSTFEGWPITSQNRPYIAPPRVYIHRNNKYSAIT